MNDRGRKDLPGSPAGVTLVEAKGIRKMILQEKQKRKQPKKDRI